jgi:hypothetical protein
VWWCSRCVDELDRERSEKQQRETQEATVSAWRTIEKFLSLADAAGNPGAEPFWMEPRRDTKVVNGHYTIDTETVVLGYGDRFVKTYAKAKKGARRRKLGERAREAYIRDTAPVGSGWTLEINPPLEQILYMGKEIEGNTERLGVKYQLVLMTSGDFEATELHPTHYSGVPFIISHHFQITGQTDTDTITDNIEWLISSHGRVVDVILPSVLALARRIGINVDDAEATVKE